MDDRRGVAGYSGFFMGCFGSVTGLISVHHRCFVIHRITTGESKNDKIAFVSEETSVNSQATISLK
jgi:hypothetical protein